MLLLKQCTNKFTNHINLRQIYRLFNFRSLVHLNFLMWAWVPSVQFSLWLACFSITFLWSYPCHSYASVKWWIHTFLKSGTDEKQEIIKMTDKIIDAIDKIDERILPQIKPNDLIISVIIFFTVLIYQTALGILGGIQFLSCWVLRL